MSIRQARGSEFHTSSTFFHGNIFKVIMGVLNYQKADLHLSCKHCMFKACYSYVELLLSVNDHYSLLFPAVDTICLMLHML